MGKRRREIDKKDVKKMHDQHQTGGRSAVKNPPDGIEMWPPERGTFVMDVIPYEVTKQGHPHCAVGKMYHCREYYIHRNIGIDEKYRICFKSWGEACPVCKEAAELKKQGNDDGAKQLRAQRRLLYNIFINKELKVLDAPYASFQKIIETDIKESIGPDEADEKLRYLDIDGGKSLEVRFIKDSYAGTPYYPADKVNFIDRKRDIPDDILEQAVDLDTLLVKLPYEELEKELYGGEVSPSVSEEDDVPIKRKRAEPEEDSPSKKRKADPDYEDDDEVLPKRRKKAELEEEDILPPKRNRQEEDDIDDNPPVRRKKIQDDDPKDEDRKGKKKTSSENECPHDHRFGKDCEKFKECDKCKLWDDCIDAQ